MFSELLWFLFEQLRKSNISFFLNPFNRYIYVYVYIVFYIIYIDIDTMFKLVRRVRCLNIFLISK